MNRIFCTESASAGISNECICGDDEYLDHCRLGLVRDGHHLDECPNFEETPKDQVNIKWKNCICFDKEIYKRIYGESNG